MDKQSLHELHARKNALDIKLRETLPQLVDHFSIVL